MTVISAATAKLEAKRHLKKKKIYAKTNQCIRQI